MLIEVYQNWCFLTVVLEKTLESLLDCNEIQPVPSKGDQSWIFIGRTVAEAETSILWPPDIPKNWLIRKVPDSGKDWRLEEKGTMEDKMVRWHHQINGHEFEQVLGVADGKGSLVCCSPWGCKESDMTWTWLDDWTTTKMAWTTGIYFLHNPGKSRIRVPADGLYAESFHPGLQTAASHGRKDRK